MRVYSDVLLRHILTAKACSKHLTHTRGVVAQSKNGSCQIK